MPQYRKKPVVINAIRFVFGSPSLEEPWFQEALNTSNIVLMAHIVPPQIIIKTLEGTMTAVEGDYIIKGIKGELYPCKSDIFTATYERV